MGFDGASPDFIFEGREDGREACGDGERGRDSDLDEGMGEPWNLSMSFLLDLIEGLRFFLWGLGSFGGG